MEIFNQPVVVVVVCAVGSVTGCKLDTFKKWSLKKLFSVIHNPDQLHHRLQFPPTDWFSSAATRTDTGNLSYKMQQPFIMQFRYLTYSDLLFHLNILLIFKVVFPLYYWFRNIMYFFTIAWNFKNMGKIKYFLILLLSIIVFVRCIVKQIKLYLQVWLNHLWENE